MSELGAAVTETELRLRLNKFSRLSLADLPTPLLDCPRLSEEVGGASILVKREDQTGMAFGGNKVREFEYSVAPAIDGGYDILLHGAASQSNQSRLTAAMAARFGLRAVMVGRKDAHSDPVNGNLLLSHLFGAEVFLTERSEEKEEVVERLQAEGYKVYNTSSDGYYLRSVSYVDGFLELWGQLKERDLMPDALYVCSGVHTHVGLVVGARALGVSLRIIGISPSPQDNDKNDAMLAGVANEVSRMLDLDLTFSGADMESYGDYAGEAYGVVTPASRDAVILAARKEALVLDPVYTGKTLGALIQHIREGRWQVGQTVVFVHTGGTPALFAYGDEVLNG
ncbi:MAG TPA: D-cysteine desulfhydrase family protein [Candidatus Latescibacteria bacterium]|nr:D-cysteine desulfhydrase family protein [Candidatus Latescibacterota bacterium]